VPDDCDGDGKPDVQQTGPSSGIWSGNYTGTGTSGLFNYGTSSVSNWRNSQNLVVGRPGTRTAAQITLPSNLPSSGGLIAFSCSNAVYTLTVSDAFTRNTSLTFGMNGRTLVVSSQVLSLQKTGGGSLIGLFDTGGITSSTGIQFQNSVGNATWWLRSCNLVAPSVTYDSLQMSGGLLQTSALQGTNLQLDGTVVLLPTGSTWSMTTSLTNREDASSIRTGTTGTFLSTGGSALDIEGKLACEGQATLSGSTRILGNTTSSVSVPGTISARSITLSPASSTEALTVFADISGAAPFRNTPLLDADLSVSLRGRIVIDPQSGSEQSPMIGWSIPIARGSSLSLPTPATMSTTSPLPNGIYMVPSRDTVGTTLSAKIVRGRYPTPSFIGNRDLSLLLRRSASLNGGVRTRIAGITNNGTSNSQLVILMRSASGSNGFDVQTTTTIPPDARDVTCGDLDGDGLEEIVVAYGAYSGGTALIPGKVMAYKVSSTGTLNAYWTHTLQSSQSANAVCVIRPPGAAMMAPSLMPTGGSVGVGTSTSTGGSLKTLSGTTGTTTGETATTETVSRIMGTDIDNDEDTDVVSSGTATSLVTSTGVVRVFRSDAVGRITAESPISLPGIAGNFAVGDIDGDGVKHIVAALSPANRNAQTLTPTAALLQGSSQSFAAPRSIDIGQSLGEGTDVALLDADEDGDLDIAISWNVFGNTTLGGTTIVPVCSGTGGIALGGPVTTVSRPCHGLTVTPDGLASLSTAASSGLSAVVLNGMTGSNAPGDLDGDGFVNSADIALLLLDYGPCPGQSCAADLDANGVIDNADLAFLLLMFD